MDEIMVVYWSQTGNTEAMAQAVAQGIEEAGKKAKAGRSICSICS